MGRPRKHNPMMGVAGVRARERSDYNRDGELKARAKVRRILEGMQLTIEEMLIENEKDYEDIDRGYIKEHVGCVEDAALSLVEAQSKLRYARGQDG